MVTQRTDSENLSPMIAWPAAGAMTPVRCCWYRQFRNLCRKLLIPEPASHACMVPPTYVPISPARSPFGSAPDAKAQLLGTLQAARLRRKRLLPRTRWPVQASFPSAAEDDHDAAVDLNELLAPLPEACCLLHVNGHSMTGADIDDGGVLVVDRALEPGHGRIVIAVGDGEFTLKRLHCHHHSARLEAAHQDYPPITLSDGQELQVWGVVTRVIKSV